MTAGFLNGPQAQAVNHCYNPDGSRQQLLLTPSAPAGNAGLAFTYDYDGIGRTASTMFPNQTGYTFHYLDNGWLQNVQGFGPNGSNGVVSTYQYNPMGRLTGLMHTLNGNLLSGFSGMKYDGAGNRLTMTTTVPAEGEAPRAQGAPAAGY